jgi:MFS family permease
MAHAAMLSEEHRALHWRGAYLWFVSLSYFFQGFYFLGTRIFVLTRMANWGVLTDTQATVLAILGLPSYLKIFPAILSDRVPVRRWGRRKPYIFLGGLVYIPSYLLLIKVQEFGWIWVATILLLLFAWMLTDASLDALTVDITPQERIGQMQGAVQSSRQAGGIFGILLVPLLGPRLGWTSVLVTLGTGALISSGAALFLREHPISRSALEKELPLKWVLREAFNHKLVWLGLFFILFFSATTGTGNLLSIYLLSELGWNASPDSMQTFAQVQVLSTIATAAGAFFIGRLPSKTITSFRFYAGYVFAFWILTLPWLLVDHSPGNLVLVYCANILVGIGWGIRSVLIAALAMRICPKSIEGFTFALMGSMFYLGSLVVGAKTASGFVERLGGVVPALFTLIPYGLISLFILYPLLQTINRQADRPKAVAA